MQKTERDLLGPGFEWRLRAALDRVQPRNSAPRYQQARAVRSWRVAPVALVGAVTGVLALAIYAAAGGTAASEIGHSIVNAIQTNQQTNPTPPPSNAPAPAPKAAPVPAPNHEKESPEPSKSKNTPEPSEQPEPGETSGSPEHSTGPRPIPSPEAGDRSSRLPT